MKSNIKFVTTFLALILLGSCQDFSELVKNPNLPNSAPPSLLLTGVLEHMNDQNAWDGKQGSQSAAQFYLSTYDYYGTNNYDQTPFTKSENNFEYTKVMQNIVQMEIEAKKGASTDLNPYTALAKFLKAYYFNLMSQKMGDIPLSEALQGDKNSAPKYDTQKDVYVKILSLLDEANSDLSKIINTGNTACVGAFCKSISGDIYLGNSLAKWQQVVNSFTLRVLISLSKKDSDAELNIKQKFSAIISDPVKYPLFSGLADNLQYNFNAAYNPYPKNPTSLGRDGTRENTGSTFLELATTLNDPRTFVTSTPAPRQVENNIYKIISGGSTTASLTTTSPAPFIAGETIEITGVSVAGYNKTAVIIAKVNDSTWTYSVAAGMADVPDKPKVEKKFVPVGAMGKKFTDFTAYVGAKAGLSMSDLGKNAQGGQYSYINALRYSFDFGGTKAESAIIIGYPEMCFNIAEGINRGWAVGNAATWYTNGITASMNFLGLSEGSSIAVGNLDGTKTYGSVTVSLAGYLAQTAVQYQGGAAGLTQILNQKYLAFWQNSTWEAFFNQRRTGIPIFSEGPGSGGSAKVAKRWQYPRAEADANSANYNEAVVRQYGANKDDLSSLMWILK